MTGGLLHALPHVMDLPQVIWMDLLFPVGEATAHEPPSGDKTTSTKKPGLHFHQTNTLLFYSCFSLRKEKSYKTYGTRGQTIQLHPVTISYSSQPVAPVISDVELMGGQGVHERTHQVVCGEVEDEPERDGDGEGRQRFLEHGEEQKGQTQTLQDTKGR